MKRELTNTDMKKTYMKYRDDGMSHEAAQTKIHRCGKTNHITGLDGKTKKV